MSSAMPELLERLIVDGTKVGWYPERIAAWKRGERIAPVTIDCAMTRRCQYACDFCYAQMQASESEIPISKESFFAFLEDAAAIGVKGVSFISDGESTLVPWYADAVEHAAKLGLAVGAGSNGHKLTKDVLERVLPHLSYLRFNFSAGEEHRYAQIMGVPRKFYSDVVQNIKDGMEIIRRGKSCWRCKGTVGYFCHRCDADCQANPCDRCHESGYVETRRVEDCDKCNGTGRIPLGCTLNMQLVCDPKDGDQLIPFARLCCELRPSYGVIKHCADDSQGTLGVDYTKYDALMEAFDRCEELGREAGVRIEVKRSRLDGKRDYHRCYGPPFIMQISGNGLVAPCGFLFNEKYKAFHIGNITRQRFKDIWASDRYKEVLDYLASDHFDPSVRCGPNCLQHNTNRFLYDHVHRGKSLPLVADAPPHMEFL